MVLPHPLPRELYPSSVGDITAARRDSSSVAMQMFDQPVISRDHRSAPFSHATSRLFLSRPFLSLSFFFLPASRSFPSHPPCLYSPRIRDRRELAGIVNHGYWTVSILLPLAGIAIRGILDIHPSRDTEKRGRIDHFHASLSPTLCMRASARRVVIIDKH